MLMAGTKRERFALESFLKTGITRWKSKTLHQSIPSATLPSLKLGSLPPLLYHRHACRAPSNKGVINWPVVGLISKVINNNETVIMDIYLLEIKKWKLF